MLQPDFQIRTQEESFKQTTKKVVINHSIKQFYFKQAKGAYFHKPNEIQSKGDLFPQEITTGGLFNV